MIVIRRELPPSSDVGRFSARAERHIEVSRGLRTVASPPGSARPLADRNGLRHSRPWNVLRNGPHKPGQLAGHRHHGDLRGFPAAYQPPELSVQAILRALRNLKHWGWTALPALGQHGTGSVAPAITPGRFYQDPAQVRVARFGNAAPMLVDAATVLGAHEAGRTHVRRRVRKPAKVLGFGHQCEGAQRVHALQAAQGLHQPSIRDRLREILDLLCYGGHARLDFLERTQIRRARLFQRRQIKMLRVQPPAVAYAPGLSLLVEAPMTQQEFAQTVPRTKAIDEDVFGGTHEIPRGFLAVGGDSDRRQFASAVQPSQLFRIAPVGLDPIARPDRNQGGGDNFNARSRRATSSRCTTYPQGPAS